MEEKIKKIFLDKLNEKVLSVKDVSKGVDQTVKIVFTKNKKFIIKFPKKLVSEFLMREYLALTKLKDLIPCPKLVLKTQEYIIETYIEGEDIDEANLSLKEKISIYEELGVILKKIHSVKLKKFGNINSEGIGWALTLKEAVFKEEEIKENLNYLRKEILSEDLYLKLNSYLKKNKKYLELNQSSLLHADYEDWNIKVKNGKVSGILDFGDLFSGPPSYDLAKPYISHLEDGFFKHLLKGYGKIDIGEVKYFAITTLLWLIPFRHYSVEGKKLSIDKELNVLKSILK